MSHLMRDIGLRGSPNTFIKLLRKDKGMSRKTRSSIVFQISQAITEINQIGISKKEARRKGEEGIHSIKQIKETLSAAQNFGKWIRDEYGVRSIYNLTEEHYRSYLIHLIELKRSAGHRQNVETALRHLQKGMAIRSDRLGLEQTIFAPTARLTDWRQLKKAEDRSYTQEEFEMILSHVSDNVRDAILLQRYIGLRVRESCNVCVKHFILDEEGNYSLRIKNEEAKGITKGGRYRNASVPLFFQTELKRMLVNKVDDDPLIDVKVSTVRKGVNRACQKAGINQRGRGTHGFRHLFCRDRLMLMLEENQILKQGIAMLERIMANRDKGRKADYGILSNTDKKIYSQLKGAIDSIHEEIGHGEDRWDLAERYLRI